MGESQGVFSLAFSALTVLSVWFVICFMMDNLKIASLNINGGRDRNKRALLVELSKNKNIDVFFIQETHSTNDNEVDWGRNWDGQVFLSHGTNLSAGL